MADIEFVIEAPQVTRTNKKRPRLVTSCDHCRVKKIKCVQQPAIGACEACMTASLACLYRDREQYFAERTRMLSGATSALRDASGSAQSRAQLSAIHTSKPAHSRGPTPPSPPQSSASSSCSSTDHTRTGSPAYYSYARLDSTDIDAFPIYPGGTSSSSERPTWDCPAQPLPWSPRREAHTGMARCGPLATQMSPLAGLFDPMDQNQPHPDLMVNFLHVFFEKLGPSYPFLLSESVYERFFHHQLPPLLANSIAAAGARLSTLPDIIQIGPANVADVYCQYAKSLVPPENTPATVDTVHALMLLAWAEYKRGRQSMFSAYSRSVNRLASELGISEDSLSTLTRISDSHSAHMLHATLQAIQLLERTVLASELAAFSTGPLLSPNLSSHYNSPLSHSNPPSTSIRPVSLW